MFIFLQRLYTFQVLLVKAGKKVNEVEIFSFGFSALLKVSGTFGVDLHVTLEYQREVACKFFELLCFVFLRAAPIPNV